MVFLDRDEIRLFDAVPVVIFAKFLRNPSWQHWNNFTIVLISLDCSPYLMDMINIS